MTTKELRVVALSDQAWTGLIPYKNTLRRIMKDLENDESDDAQITLMALCVVCGEMELRGSND